MYSLQFQNRYPDCLSLTLESSSPSQGKGNSCDLVIDLTVGEQWQDILKGKVKFRLQGGKLRIHAENASLTPLTASPESNYQIISTTESELVAGFRLNYTKKQLPFTLDNLKIAQFLPSSPQWCVTLQWEISPVDIYLTDAEGLWKHDITPNKHAILERCIIQRLHKIGFMPYLSCLQVTSQGSETEKTLLLPSVDFTETSHLSDLPSLIQSIYDVKTNDFLELAKLAGLDPQKDLAGGNFIATSLCGLELGQANLCYTHFRGADLTDIDLSEAQLSYANFSGADLSGGYLGDANLQYTDFHRASLALANLIGADLTKANLIETNLSQANLSGAVVTDAQFGQNVGLSPEDKEDLQQRGAIFIE
ncbi:MAG: pentapeptide repeat-containing protein [Microcystaceae cyanobacterium]